MTTTVYKFILIVLKDCDYLCNCELVVFIETEYIDFK